MTLPNDWRAYGEMIPISDVDAVFVKFCSWHRSEATLKADWYEAWKSWLVDEQKHQRVDRERGRTRAAGDAPSAASPARRRLSLVRPRDTDPLADPQDPS